MKFVRFAAVIALLYAPAVSYAQKTIVADTPEVRYVGRTAVSGSGHVSYDWVGTYFSTVLYGGRLDARISCNGEAWFNVFVDGKQHSVFSVNSADTVVNIVNGIGRRPHAVRVQKRSEGEYGRVTVKEFILPSSGGLAADADIPGRHIEFIGNSLTCGFGTEGKDRNEPFKVSTENCNLSYAAITARYFDADYTMIAHSGQGAVRNYGDSVRTSSVCMKDRMMRCFDMDTVSWAKGYVPDLVVINLGTNDFSTEPHPCRAEFIDGYCTILRQIRQLYGQVPVICVCPPTTACPLNDYLHDVREKMSDADIHVIELVKGLYNMDSDLGSAWHPNYKGQVKMAMSLIPYISTVTGWDIETGKNIM